MGFKPTPAGQTDTTVKVREGFPPLHTSLRACSSDATLAPCSRGRARHAVLQSRSPPEPSWLFRRRTLGSGRSSSRMHALGPPHPQPDGLLAPDDPCEIFLIQAFVSHPEHGLDG